MHIEPQIEEEDLVTIVEKEKFDAEKKTIIVTDRFRTIEKLLRCDSLEDCLCQGEGDFARP